MDNREFDDIVKGRLESLNPTFKEGAWEDLHYKLDLLAPMPWYSRWKSLLIGGTLGIITLINVGLLLKVNENQAQMQQILQELNESKSPTHTETFYVTTSDNYLGSSITTSRNSKGVLNNNSWLQNPGSLFDPFSVYKITGNTPSYNSSGSQVVFGGLSGEPNSSAEYTSASISGSGEDSYSNLSRRSVYTMLGLDPFETTYSLHTPDGESMYVRGIVVPPSKKKWSQPLDLRAGLASGYLVPDPDLGERFVSSRQSILLETPIRGNLKLLSGLSFQELIYKLDDVDDDNFEQSTLLRYPDFTTFSSTPDEIRVENQILQIPIYLRYYKPLNSNWSVFAGGGPTLDLLLKQKFIYSFLEIQNEQLVEFEEVRSAKDVRLNLGSLSGNIGIEHYFSPRISAQMELNYQFGLGKIGLEKRTFNSFSINGGLFYKLRSR